MAVLLFPPTLPAQVRFSLNSIVRPHDAAPVPPELVQASSPLLNNAGQVAFLGDGALFLQSNGTSALLAAPGDRVPTGILTDIRLPALNDQGQVAFLGSVLSPGRSGIFLADGKVIRVLVADGEPAPGGGQLTTQFVSLNAAGQAAFSANTNNPGQYNRSGIFLLSEGRIAPVARTGDPAPGGGTFNYLGGPPALNSGGQIAFGAFLDPTGVGLFLFSDGAITAIARTGDPARDGGTFDLSFPPPPANQLLAPTNAPELRSLGANLGGAPTYEYLGGLSINDRGQVAFAATTIPSGHGGIFLYSEGRVTPVVRELDPAPGGGVFTGFSPSLNALGQIAFRGSTTTGEGMFLYSEGKVTQVVRPPQPAPEGDPFLGFGLYPSPSLNDAGQLAFAGEFANRLGGVYLFSDNALFRVAGPGDPINRAPTFVSAAVQGINTVGEVLIGASSFPGGFGLFNGTNLVVRAGDPAPKGGVFASVGESGGATIPGQVAFLARTSGRPGFIYGLYGLFLARDGVLTRIAATNDPAPGGGTFGIFSSPSINNNGEIAFWASTDREHGFDWGVFILSGGEQRRLFGRGDPAPDGQRFLFVGSMSFNDAGQLAFTASTFPGGRASIFLGSLVLAQSGAPAPGGGTFVGLGAPSLNGLGEVAFSAGLSTGERGVFLFSRGLSAIALPEDSAPEGGRFAWADSPTLNDPGQVAFRASGPAGIGAYLYSGGSIIRVVAPGEPAPGGGTFTSAAAPMLNAQGQIAFTGGVLDGSGAFLATPVR